MDNPLPPYVLNDVQFRYLLVKGFLFATIYKCMNDMSRVKLPAVSKNSQHRSRNNRTDSAVVKRTMDGADVLTDTLVRFTTRKCFFRAFTTVYVLREKGIAVTLNIGLHHLSKKDRTVRGHCWSSWNGRPIGEPSNPHVRYHRFLGTGQNGVCYWLGGEKTAKHKIVRYRTAAKGPNRNAAFKN